MNQCRLLQRPSDVSTTGTALHPCLLLHAVQPLGGDAIALRLGELLLGLGLGLVLLYQRSNLPKLPVSRLTHPDASALLHSNVFLQRRGVHLTLVVLRMLNAHPDASAVLVLLRLLLRPLLEGLGAADTTHHLPVVRHVSETHHLHILGDVIHHTANGRTQCLLGNLLGIRVSQDGLYNRRLLLDLIIEVRQLGHHVCRIANDVAATLLLWHFFHSRSFL